METTFQGNISVESGCVRTQIVKKSLSNYKKLKRQTRRNNKQIKFARKSLMDLTNYERTIVRFRFWNNYSVSEIASIIGLPQTMIQRFLDEAIHKLRLSYLIEFSVPKSKTPNKVSKEDLM